MVASLRSAGHGAVEANRKCSKWIRLVSSTQLVFSDSWACALPPPFPSWEFEDAGGASTATVSWKSGPHPLPTCKKSKRESMIKSGTRTPQDLEMTAAQSPRPFPSRTPPDKAAEHLVWRKGGVRPAGCCHMSGRTEVQRGAPAGRHSWLLTSLAKHP